LLRLLSKNHSSQSLLLPEPIMYCGRNDAQAQLPANCSAMYRSTPTCPALSFTASCAAPAPPPPPLLSVTHKMSMDDDSGSCV